MRRSFEAFVILALLAVTVMAAYPEGTFSPDSDSTAAEGSTTIKITVTGPDMSGDMTVAIVNGGSKVEGSEVTRGGSTKFPASSVYITETLRIETDDGRVWDVELTCCQDDMTNSETDDTVAEVTLVDQNPPPSTPLYE